jgi:hypothetical protein
MEKKFITYIMLICKSSNFFSKFNQYIHKLLHYFTFFKAITDREVQWKYIKLIFKSSNFEPLANLTNTFTNFQHGFTFKAILNGSLMKSTFPLVPATWIIFNFEIASSNSSIYQINITKQQDIFVNKVTKYIESHFTNT